MNRPVASIRLAHNSEQPGEAYPRFHGYWLVLARLLWIALAVLILILYLFGFPAAFRYYKSILYRRWMRRPAAYRWSVY